MPEYLKAMIVVLGLSLPIFWLAQKPASEYSVFEPDFRRRRNLWYAATLLAFLSPSFWVYVVLFALVLLFAAPREQNRLAAFMFLLFAIPAMNSPILGVAGIRQLIGISPPRLLSMILLIPAWLWLRRDPESVPFGKTLVDKCLLGYILLPLALQFTVDSFTNTVRFGIYAFTDVFIPYYVASRGMRHMAAWRDALMSFVVGVLLLCIVALFEYFRHWLLYSSMASHLGVASNLGAYMLRGDGLRAMATAGHSIVLGYVVVIALAFFIFVQRSVTDRRLVWLAVILMVGALLGSGARGPWLGGVAVLLIMTFTGPRKAGRTMQLVMIMLPVVALMWLTPLGDKFLPYLPFIGDADAESVSYRQRLFEVSMQVIRIHPLLGSFDYLTNPMMQELVQGDGIIDVVNSYLGIALTYGAIGLALFCGVFLAGGYGLWAALKTTDASDEMNLLGRALLAALGGVMLTIATVSGISFVPWAYWILAGLCVAYAQMVALVPSSAVASSTSSWAARFAPRA